MLVVTVALPSRYRSTRCWGIESMNGGWLLVVGLVVDYLTLEVCVSPICGSSRVRAS